MNPADVVDEARRLYATGLTAADTARLLSLPWSTVAHRRRGDLRCAALDRLGIAHRRPHWDQVPVARREAVAALDGWVGPKT